LTTTGTLKADGSRAAVARWLPAIREHKTAILAALAERAKCSHVDDLTDADYDDPALTTHDTAYRRQAAAEPGYDATAQARYCCECTNLAADRRCLASERLGALESWRPTDRRPRRCRGFTPSAQVQLPEQAAIAPEAEDLQEYFEERSAILKHAGLPRAEAELEAARMTATLARNRGYLWASLRAALVEYPALAPLVPATPGTVATVAVLKGGRAVRQGAFTGAHEVKA